MAIVTPTILTALNTGVKKNFQDGYAQMRANAFWDKVATLIPSTTASNTYGWLGDFPQLRKWVGARVIRDMKASGYSIENRLYEATLGVQRTQIEDDQYGHFAPVSMSMGQEAAQHPDRLVQAVINAGGTSLCYDGQYFFDTDHPVYRAGRTWTKDGTVLDRGDLTREAWEILQAEPLIHIGPAPDDAEVEAAEADHLKVAIRQAIAALENDGFGQDGAPLLDAVRKALPEGSPAITKKQVLDTWAELKAETAGQ